MRRERFEAIEDRCLMPYAMRSRDSRGRAHAEPEHAFRMAFQRDRDRIIHSSAFRRLEYKTQVFVNHEGDYYRTRLTHTMEAAQITRTVARALGLNEDLAEAVALAHDLGHPPFGHAGERALDRVMSPHGGFEHNAQSLRIVEQLEERSPSFPGLNLTWEVREGIVKHSLEYDRPQVQPFVRDLAPCLEAQIVDVADEIAYSSHDIDDGLKSGMLTVSDLEGVDLFERHYHALRGAFPSAGSEIHRYQTVRRIIDAMVSDLIAGTCERLERHRIRSVDDVRACRQGLAGFSNRGAEEARQLKSRLMATLYSHYRVTRMAVKAEKVITDLFGAYMAEPHQLPPHVSRKIASGEDQARVIADYVAGMTDRFALREHAKLFDPYERV